MLKQLKSACLMMTAMTVLTGLVYPAVVTGLAQVFFRDPANGSLIVRSGEIVGSRLIGQRFTKPEYFHPRPSAAGADGYDAAASAGSNLGPTSAKLLRDVKARIVDYCRENEIPYDASGPKTPIPADAVTASASGLDPHISPRNAELQTSRVAKARGVSVDRVQALVARHTEPRTLGILGEPRVNVLMLNLALDDELGAR